MWKETLEGTLGKVTLDKSKAIVEISLNDFTESLAYPLPAGKNIAKALVDTLGSHRFAGMNEVRWIASMKGPLDGEFELLCQFNDITMSSKEDTSGERVLSLKMRMSVTASQVEWSKFVENANGGVWHVRFERAQQSLFEGDEGGADDEAA